MTQEFSDHIRFAQQKHAGQVDKAGKPYIEHLKAVAFKVEQSGGQPEAVLTAWFHDIIEDCDVTSAELLSRGVPREVVEAVEAMTKREGEDYADYLARVKANSIARLVKLADLEHNMDLGRIPNATDKDYARLEKYKIAREFLAVP